MSDLLSLDDVMKELQIDEEQLKDLVRNDEIEYVLHQGRVRFPKEALLLFKNHKMASHTSQIARQKRQKKPSKNHVSLDEAMQMLNVGEETLQTLVLSQRLRTVDIDGEQRVPITAIDALKIQMPKNLAKQSTRKLQKRKPSVKRKY